MDALIDSLLNLGWDMRESLTITFNKTRITALPISSTETSWIIQSENRSHNFISEVGPDEYYYVVDKLNMFF